MIFLSEVANFKRGKDKKKRKTRTLLTTGAIVAAGGTAGALKPVDLAQATADGTYTYNYENFLKETKRMSPINKFKFNRTAKKNILKQSRFEQAGESRKVVLARIKKGANSPIKLIRDFAGDIDKSIGKRKGKNVLIGAGIATAGLAGYTVVKSRNSKRSTN